ncbi:putative cytokinetic ring protein SteA [Serpentinicella sp. ANB-PHB4]|uniref:putative cytokinetic ring protein SteA n=1 Tax=Serpentinicella sp. ANB-PHB4 TaxID=3074076 RepID=UPI00285CC24C|nr:putative cytokinetic ring protein SteA [Serpentinicella sp. ANB-PHB4]MDR5658177.1 putative cytokinetic ring protein SteA [Serpentinicella sp. ANB-PHB4]
MIKVKAPVKLGKSTKKLINKLNYKDIAIIKHQDLDEMAAMSLVEKNVSAVINCEESVSGRYPNLGPQVLLKHHIPLYDVLKENNIFEKVTDNDVVLINHNKLFLNKNEIAQLELMSSEKLGVLHELAKQNLEIELEKFIDNTLTYAKQEKAIITDSNISMPNLSTQLKNKQVVIVVRGQNYRDDLITILPYIRDVRPVLIGVDGGADALVDFGCTPDIIIGDMDSVSDKTLLKCQEIIVHAYTDGRAPGLKRIEKLKLNKSLFPAAGTSEDVAMLLAYENGADLIVAVGTHTNMIDFLEKGRKGMGSTFLVRLKVGSKLIDARGVSKLYSKKFPLKYITSLCLAAMLPILVILIISQPLILEILKLRLRLFLDL